MKTDNQKFSIDSIFSLESILEDIVSRLPGLDEELNRRGINLLEGDNLNIFGYGSLVTKPVGHPSNRQNAYLDGWRRDFSCESIMSGTPEKPGLTFGLDSVDNSITAGVVFGYEDLEPTERLAVLNEYANREVPKGNPIYTFKILDVTKEDGTVVPAISCVADPLSSRYFGNGLKEQEQSLPENDKIELSVQRKAEVIATAFTTLRDGDPRTSKSYFDRFARIPTEKTLREEFNDKASLSPMDSKLLKEHKYIIRLADAIDKHRSTLSEERQAFLKKIEDLQMEKYQRTIQKAEKSKSVNNKTANPKSRNISS